MKLWRLPLYIENIFMIYTLHKTTSLTYDHRTLKTRLPVRSALFKQSTGGLVVKWVTIGESLLLYVFDLFLSSQIQTFEQLQIIILYLIFFFYLLAVK